MFIHGAVQGLPKKWDLRALVISRDIPFKDAIHDSQGYTLILYLTHKGVVEIWYEHGMMLKSTNVDLLYELY